jgi:hypothetical protein
MVVWCRKLVHMKCIKYTETHTVVPLPSYQSSHKIRVCHLVQKCCGGFYSSCVRRRRRSLASQIQSNSWETPCVRRVRAHAHTRPDGQNAAWPAANSPYQPMASGYRYPTYCYICSAYYIYYQYPYYTAPAYSPCTTIYYLCNIARYKNWSCALEVIVHNYITTVRQLDAWTWFL